MIASLLNRLMLILLMSFSSILTLQANTVHQDDSSKNEQSLRHVSDQPQYEDESISYENTFFVDGNIFINDAFRIDEAGTYQGILTDMQFPNPLLQFGMTITSATRNYGSIFDAGSFLFDIKEPGTYYVNIFASSLMKRHDFGGVGLLGANVNLFSGINTSQLTAVPVPGALFLFSSALLSFSSFARRGRKTV